MNTGAGVNTFRYQSFADRVAHVDVDVAHDVRHANEDAERGEDGTYLGAEFKRLSELDITGAAACAVVGCVCAWLRS